jgi:hypothetical protein
MIGNFSITQYGYAADKPGKDNNFRGLTIAGNTLFVSKGSGGNGINTVYQVGLAGTLPNEGSAASAPITILPGFPTTLAKNADAYAEVLRGVSFTPGTHPGDRGDVDNRD